MEHTWTCKLLKQNARAALAGRRIRCFWVSLAAMLLGAGGTAAAAIPCLICGAQALHGLRQLYSPVWLGFNQNPQRTWILAAAAVLCALLGVLWSLLAGLRGAPLLAVLTAALCTMPPLGEDRVRSLTLLCTLLLILLCLSWYLFFALPVNVGLRRYFLENRLGPAPAATLFGTLHSAYGGTLNALLCVWLKVLFGSVLPIFGIPWSYRYRMVPALLAENPHLSARRAMELSTEMMQGEKRHVFLLDLSFVGWALLGLCTLGVGLLVLEPWYQAVQAELYAALRAKALAYGLTTPEELRGFARYV